MVRFGKTRYGHPFSKGKTATAWVGGGSRRGLSAVADGSPVKPMPDPEGRAPARVALDLVGLRVWEAIDNDLRIKISCDNCQHETVWTSGYMKKKLHRWRGQTLSRLAQNMRCGGCRSNYIKVWRG